MFEFCDLQDAGFAVCLDAVFFAQAQCMKMGEVTSGKCHIWASWVFS